MSWLDGIQNQDAEEKRAKEHSKQSHEALCERINQHEGR
jgi:hypothetical protein